MNNQNKAVVSGGIGGAAAILIVIFGDDMGIKAFADPDKAAMATAAMTVLFQWAARFLPKPPAGPTVK